MLRAAGSRGAGALLAQRVARPCALCVAAAPGPGSDAAGEAVRGGPAAGSINVSNSSPVLTWGAVGGLLSAKAYGFHFKAAPGTAAVLICLGESEDIWSISQLPPTPGDGAASQEPKREQQGDFFTSSGVDPQAAALQSKLLRTMLATETAAASMMSMRSSLSGQRPDLEFYKV